MNKVSREVLDKCTAANCTDNELLVLPSEGDVGYEEYFRHKSRLVMEQKNIFSSLEHNELLLCFPPPGERQEMNFDLFFESPQVVACNHDFEGCFGIDITAYVNHRGDKHFEDLLAYARSHPETVYVFILASNNKNEIRDIYEYLTRYMEVRKVEMSLPEPRRLAEYSISEIRHFCLHISAEVSVLLEEFFEAHRCGYEAAEYLCRKLKNTGYDGSREQMQLQMDELVRSHCMSGSSAGFGI